eukprot:6657368-Prymnesium_polylepis.1
MIEQSAQSWCKSWWAAAVQPSVPSDARSIIARWTDGASRTVAAKDGSKDASAVQSSRWSSFASSGASGSERSERASSRCAAVSSG